MKNNIFLKKIQNGLGLFSTNQDIRQIVIKNTLWLTLAEGLSKVLKLILIVFVARTLGVEGYGQFSFALAFVSLFVVFSDFGLTPIITREFAREPDGEKEFSYFLSLKLVLVVVTFFAIVVGAFFITRDPVVQKGIFILGGFIITNSLAEIIFGFLRARQKMKYEAGNKILQAIFATVLGVLVIIFYPSVENLAWSYFIASAVALLALLLFFHLKIFRIHLRWDISVWKKIFSLSWPLGMVAIFTVIYNYIDSVMLGFFGLIAETGLYNAAYRVILISFIPSLVLSQSFYPALSRAYKESSEKLQAMYDHYMVGALSIAVPLVAGGVSLAFPIIDFLFGKDFYPAVLALQILVFAAGLTIVSGPISHVLIIANEQKKNFWVTFCAAVTNIILNTLLIPIYGFYGAAAATLATVFGMFLVYYYLTRKFTTVQPINRNVTTFAFVAVLASAMMYLGVIVSKMIVLPILVIIILATVIYVLFYFIFYRLLI